MTPETATADLSVAEVRDEVLALIPDAPEGEPLDEVTCALIRVAVNACGTTLNLPGARNEMDQALALGATPEQLWETLILISGIGLHCLLACSSLVQDAVTASGDDRYAQPLTSSQSALLDEFVDERERRTSTVAPGFAESAVRLGSEEMFRAVYGFRAVPWMGTATTTLQKELIGIAVDTMASHRFLPTLRLHVRRAVDLGAGRTAIVQTLDISGAAPDHRGVR